LLGFSAFSQNIDSVSYFNGNGTLSWWYLQKDVILFRTQNDSAYTGYLDTLLIDDFNFYEGEASNFNELLLNSNTTLTDLINIKNDIINSGQFQIFAAVLTKYPYDPNVQQKYYRTDDQLLITFHDPLLDSVSIANFAQQYSLKLLRKPLAGLNNSVSWSYVFQLDSKPDTLLNTIIMANVIATYEPLLVKIVTPNIIGGEQLGCVEHNEMAAMASTNNYLWHIRNNGDITFGGQTGTVDADADICECWGEGYTGEGIHVGVIDGDVFKSSHPDLKPFGIGLDGTNNNIIQPGAFFNPFGADSHGMVVSGLIAAKPGNNSALKRSIGVAYGATLHPYYTTLSSASVRSSIQGAITQGMDVVNMSFTVPFDANISSDINNGILTGRPDGNGGFKGIVFVAGSGNSDSQQSFFPANDPNVIGVGSSNPNDYRSANLNGWAGANSGSSYGPPSFNYDVVAPGELLFSMKISGGGGGVAFDAEGVDLGTSISTPVVSSIAAILLEKNPGLTALEVRNHIRNGAEKVHPTVYNYNLYTNAPGYNDEMFYGRVNCLNSLNQVLSINENELQKLTLQHLEDGSYILILPKSEETQNVKILNSLGQTVWETSTQKDQQEVAFTIEPFTNGMYFLQLSNKNKLVGNSKLIK